MPMAGGATGAIAPGGGPYTGEDAVVLFDLSNPDAPRRAGKVVLSGSDWSWGLRAEAGLLWLTHHEWTDDARGVRYYLDRIDVSDPDAPVLLPKVNVPGTFLGTSGARRVYTLDTRWDDSAASATSLVHALDLTDRGTARLVGTISLPGWTSGAVLGSGHAWVVTQDWTGGRSDVRLAALDLAALRVASSQRLDASWAWPLLAGSGKLFLAAGTTSGASVLVLSLSSPARAAARAGGSHPGVGLERGGGGAGRLPPGRGLGRGDDPAVALRLLPSSPLG